MTSGIYGLVDDDYGCVVYVGRGFDIESRYKEHYREAQIEMRNTLKRGWLDYPITRNKRNCLAYLLIEGGSFTSVVLEEVIPDIYIQDERERFWGFTLSQAGHPLSNGGTSGTRFTGHSYSSAKKVCPYTKTLAQMTLSNGKRVIPIDRLPFLEWLRLGRPDLYKQVLAGELSPNAGMIEAGIRQPRFSIPTEPNGAARAIRRHFTADQIAQLIDALGAENE